MIQVSESAIEEIIRLKTKQSITDAFLRLKVAAGGCSGFLYLTQFDQTLQPDDYVHNCVGSKGQGVKVAIDAQSLTHLNSLSLDFAEDLMGGSFRFHNPQATKTCGCGVSFGVTER
ncbi:HesB/IscA family protein [Myxacorys almedinensis]|uniref:Iron-sulfur cluster assembly accessory protein n=1 Tax=Myxacorys almedinensis A TaxID=2690445 RepID=A0A8J7Z383_9CYAN|nr:iron-sulfur cluster assembly accessory protein [Myxacorys almedinensis]NDJ17006.1 iron-sulfur cluster assembly accessory protein [Myxacorys almedinensis A]